MQTLPIFSFFPLSLFTPGLGFKYDPGTELISQGVLDRTEKVVSTNDGRYFVAAKHADPQLSWGIYEVVVTQSGYGVKQVVPGILQVGSTSHDCWFHSLATDGTYLYAVGLVHLDGKITKSEAGAFFRILPGQDSAEVSIAPFKKDELHFYNGMAVGPDGSIYLSNSSASKDVLRDGSGVAVYKVTITDQPAFEIQITPWLYANLLRDTIPNGLQIKDDKMYYVSGKGLFEINITPTGPGIPFPLYWTSFILTNWLDDLVILPDQRVAVAEVDAVAFGISEKTGWPDFGLNQIVIVNPHNPLHREVILTTPYAISSLAHQVGNLLTNGKLIATSWVHGGLREINLP